MDDGSWDDTSKTVTEINHPNLTYVRQDNGGPSTARNRGIDLARGDYIAFTDDDCTPVPPWPWPLVRRLERESSDVAGVGGRVLPLSRGLISRYYTYHRILEPPESGSYLVTANCVYRAVSIRSVGGFDTRIRQPGGEDPALSFAIRARGFRLVFEPDGVVEHHYRESIADFVKTFYRYGKGCAFATTTEAARLVGPNELIPSSLSPKAVWTEMERNWGDYQRDGLPIHDRLRFLFLVLLQNCAYHAGWDKGKPPT